MHIRGISNLILKCGGWNPHAYSFCSISRRWVGIKFYCQHLIWNHSSQYRILWARPALSQENPQESAWIGPVLMENFPTPTLLLPAGISAVTEPNHMFSLPHSRTGTNWWLSVSRVPGMLNRHQHICCFFCSVNWHRLSEDSVNFVVCCCCSLPASFSIPAWCFRVVVREKDNPCYWKQPSSHHFMFPVAFWKCCWCYLQLKWEESQTKFLKHLR